MRILHIDKFLGDSGGPVGGVGNNVRLLAEFQRKAGHEVLFWGCAPGAADRPADMPAFRDFAAGKSPLDLPSLVHNTEAANMLARFTRKHPVDVAHLHNIYHHLTPSILPVLAARRIGIVMTARDYRLACPAKHLLRGDGPCTRCLPNRFWHAASRRCQGLAGLGLAVESVIQRFFRRYFSHIDFVICPSLYLRQTLRKTGLPAGKAVVVPNLVRAMPPAPQGRLSRRLLYAGRLSWEKGPQLMLELAQRLRDVDVVLAGDGPMEQELRRQAADRGLANVTFTGPVPHGEVGGLLERSAATVMPSLCFENSPGAMLEAMLAGYCVIVPDHPPLREWVADGRTGRLFAPGDADSLAKVVAEVLDRPAASLAMGVVARALVAERHKPETIMARLDAIYEESIDRCALRW